MWAQIGPCPMSGPALAWTTVLTLAGILPAVHLYAPGPIPFTGLYWSSHTQGRIVQSWESMLIVRAPVAASLQLTAFPGPCCLHWPSPGSVYLHLAPAMTQAPAAGPRSQVCSHCRQFLPWSLAAGLAGTTQGPSSSWNHRRLPAVLTKDMQLVILGAPVTRAEETLCLWWTLCCHMLPYLAPPTPDPTSQLAPVYTHPRGKGLLLLKSVPRVWKRQLLL